MLNDLVLYGKNLKSVKIVVYELEFEVVQLSVAVTENFLEKTCLEKFSVVFSEALLGEEVKALLNKRKGFSVVIVE
jgi:hypothetical protein